MSSFKRSLVVFLIFMGCGAPRMITESEYLMGTLVEIIVYDKNIENTRNAIDSAFNEIKRIEKGYWRIEKETNIEGEMKHLLEKGLHVCQ